VPRKRRSALASGSVRMTSALLRLELRSPRNATRLSSVTHVCFEKMRRWGPHLLPGNAACASRNGMEVFRTLHRHVPLARRYWRSSSWALRSLSRLNIGPKWEQRMGLDTGSVIMCDYSSMLVGPSHSTRPSRNGLPGGTCTPSIRPISGWMY
jgi:hypothetical protein